MIIKKILVWFLEHLTVLKTNKRPPSCSNTRKSATACSKMFWYLRAFFFSSKSIPLRRNFLLRLKRQPKIFYYWIIRETICWKKAEIKPRNHHPILRRRWPQKNKEQAGTTKLMFLFPFFAHFLGSWVFFAPFFHPLFPSPWYTFFYLAFRSLILRFFPFYLIFSPKKKHRSIHPLFVAYLIAVKACFKHHSLTWIFFQERTL